MKDHRKIEAIFMRSYDEHADAIFRYSYFQTSNRDVATDIVQETFTKTWIYLKDGKEIDNIRAFLYRVAKNLVIDHRRKKKATSLEAITETGVEFRDEVDEAEIVADDFDKKFVMSKLKELDEPYREILTMRYVDEMSIKEIADMTDMTENHVSVKIHRAVEKMKKVLEEYYPTKQ